MSRRTERVDELLRRELAMMLLSGELRDPRLQPSASIGITAVSVTNDLSYARVFVDVLSEELDRERVLAALKAGAGALRRKLGQRVQLRRTPELRFEFDESIGRGARIASILEELPETRSKPASSDPGGSEDES